MPFFSAPSLLQVSPAADVRRRMTSIRGLRPPPRPAPPRLQRAGNRCPFILAAPSPPPAGVARRQMCGGGMTSIRGSANGVGVGGAAIAIDYLVKIHLPHRKYRPSHPPLFFLLPVVRPLHRSPPNSSLSAGHEGLSDNSSLAVGLLHRMNQIHHMLQQTYIKTAAPSEDLVTRGVMAGGVCFCVRHGLPFLPSRNL
ncbi:hypothetical protein C7M84_014724 [Penaeus vannamei]|uniref:Uncharacterized protein n=1 Tax=Penaeus vannamei TaxID=6689 RepID=A0A3R7MQ47_PENVA|nr:hypothetical protein C7M84_014724 [Penaeus vannamei]